jgi:hypothetical protein
MSTRQERIIEQIGQLADLAERGEQERLLLCQQRDRLAGELEKLIEAIGEISRSPRLRALAESAKGALAANTQEPSE